MRQLGFRTFHASVHTLIGLTMAILVSTTGVTEASQAASAQSTSSQSVDAGRITAVTVLPQGAWVTREVTLDHEPKLEQPIQIMGLPQGLQSADLVVQVSGWRLASPVQLVPISADETRSVRQLDEHLADLKAELASANDRQLAASTRLAILKEQMGQQSGKSAGAFVTDPASRARFDAALDRILKQRQQARQQQTALRTQITAVEKARKKALAKGGKLAALIRLDRAGAASAAAGKPVTLSLRYRVNAAGWAPVYSARLSTDSQQVDWSMSAEVHQQTGEDWSKVSLTLATLDNRRYYPVPTLSRWTIGFVENRPRPLASAPVMAMAEKRKAGRQDAMAQQQDISEFNSEFLSTAHVSVPSERTPVIVSLGTEQLTAKLAVRIAPQSNPLPILTAQLTLPNERPLPAGQLMLFRDGSQVGGRHLAALSPKQKLALGFGVDRSIEVSYDRNPDKRDEHGLIGKSRELVRRSVLTLTNHHHKAVPITVLMHLPVAIDADISVQPLADNTPPAERRFDGREGVWAWTLEPAAGKKAVVKFGFRVRWPEDKQLGGI